MLRSRSRSVWFLASIAIIPLVYSSGTIDPAFTIRAVLLAALTVITIVVSRKDPLRTGPLLWLWMIYAAFNIVSIFAARNSGEAIYTASTVLLYGAWFFAVMQITTKDLIPAMLRTITFLGFTIASLSLFQYLDIGFGFIPGGVGPYATMTTKNLMSSFLFLTLPTTLYIIFAGSQRWSIFGLCTLAISILVLLISQTRAVWLGCAVAGIAATFIFVLSGARQTLWKSYRSGIRNGALVTIACVVAIFVFNVAPRTGPREQSAYEKAGTLVSYASDTSANMRLTVWKESLAMFWDHPMGVGAGNWKIVLPAYGLEHFPHYVQDGTYQWTEIHNDFLSALCETGVGGGLAFLAIFAVAIIIAIRATRGNVAKNSQEALLATLIAAELCGYAAISFFDFPNARVEHTMLFLVWLSLLPVRTGEDRPDRLPKTMASPIAVLLAILALVLSLQRFIAELHEKTVLEARIEQDWNTVIEECNKIYNPKLLSLDALSTPVLYYKAEAEFMEGQYGDALRDNLTALHAHPNHFYTLNNIGSSYVKIGNFREAEAFYSRALAVSPHFEESLLNMAVVYFNQGAFDTALQFVSRCDTSQSGSRAQTIARAVRAKIR